MLEILDLDEEKRKTTTRIIFLSNKAKEYLPNWEQRTASLKSMVLQITTSSQIVAL